MSTSEIKNLDIVHQGDQIILPPGMTFDEGIQWLQRKKEEEQREVAVMAPIQGYHPLDAAHAFNAALARVYGWTQQVPTPGFFGPTPPAMLSIPVDADGTTRQVPWGRIKVPRIAGFLNAGIGQGYDGKPCFVISGTTKNKDMAQVQRIEQETRAELAARSIYRGKAVRVEFDPENPLKAPEFMDLRGIKREGLIFSKHIEELVETTLWTPMRERESAEALAIPLKRGFLFEGPYGMGKTLCARVTAEIAEQSGWTFVYIEHIKDLKNALDFARMYQPAVVFAEDVDRVDDGTRSDPFNELLNTIDGVEYKRAKIFTILTTNHVERLHKSMLRPGRIDVVIEVRPPDAEASERLLKLYAGELLDPATDLAAAGRLFQGNSPAILNEVVQRAKLAALRRSGTATFSLTGEDFEVSIRTLRPQLELMTGDAKTTMPPIERAVEQLGQVMTRGLEDRVKQLEEKLG